MEDLLVDLLQYLYVRAPVESRVVLQDILNRFEMADQNVLETCLVSLERANLLSLSINRQAILLNLRGKLALEQGTALALCLGQPYIARCARNAVVAIEVINGQQDLSMGTGFFSDDFPGWVVTAQHVVSNGHQVLRIFDSEMREIQNPEPLVRLPAGTEPDIALVSCPIPGHCKPLQVEWDLGNIGETGNVLIAGYPFVAGHDRRLTYSDAFISCVATKRDTGLRSLVISRLTSPGFSGGPVIDSRGVVVGVVEQENESHDLTTRSIFVSAVPTPYLDKIGEHR